MYYIKNDVELSVLENYGFELGREIEDNERWICNKDERDDYWLVSLDDEGRIFYADDADDLLHWSVHIQKNRRVWIDCVPCCTYHIDIMDMEDMFFVLKKMIEDGIIYDDYWDEK